jgi:hypothetical protein
MADARRLAAELDTVSAGLDSDPPYPVLEKLLKRRARLAGKLAELGPPEESRESLRRAIESGERLAAKLAAERVLQRERLGRLYHAKALLQALRAPAESDGVDCRG